MPGDTGLRLHSCREGILTRTRSISLKDRNRMKKNFALLLFGCVMSATSLLAQGDPPSRVARLNYIEGYVSMQPAGIDDWVPAIVNRPFTTGDHLYTDQNSHTELHFGGGAIRMSQYTTIGILNLDNFAAQIQLAEGQLNLHVKRLAPDQTIEVDTPNVAVSILEAGDYRIDVNSASNLSFVVVRHGQVEITGGGQAFNMGAGYGAQLTGTDTLGIDIEGAPNPDAFDDFCVQRDQREARFPAPRYVSEEMIGYEDLEENGGWRTVGNYGPVWYPRSVAADWAPYRNGHWAWIEPWGWTWVDDAPWGFAPFHYGRWVYAGGGWGWTPGPVAVVAVGAPPPRPYYAPALVAFIGGSGWGVSVSVGSVSVGWVPLGWGEVYRPSYHVSAGYFQNVNVSNTVINKTVNITNVYNITYVNKTTTNVTVNYANMQAPRGVTAMPQQAFASGQPSAHIAVSLRSDQVSHIQVSQTVLVPNVVPTRTAVAPTYQVKGATPHPPAQLLKSPVVAKATPPPPAVSFQAKQAFLAKNVGQPFNAQQMHQTVRPVAQAQPVVRQAPPAKRVDIKSLPTGHAPQRPVAAPQNPVNTKAMQAPPVAPSNQKPQAVQPKPAPEPAKATVTTKPETLQPKPAPQPAKATVTTKPETVQLKPAPEPAKATVTTKPETARPVENARPAAAPPVEKRQEDARRPESNPPAAKEVHPAPAPATPAHVNPAPQHEAEKSTTGEKTTTEKKKSTTTTKKEEKKEEKKPE